MQKDSGGRASRNHKRLSIALGVAVLAAMVAVVARHGEAFVAAVGGAPAWVLLVTGSVAHEDPRRPAARVAAGGVRDRARGMTRLGALRDIGELVAAAERLAFIARAWVGLERPGS